MEDFLKILLVAMVIEAGWSRPHQSRSSCSLCPPGTRVLRECTPTSDTSCKPCDQSTFSGTPSNSTKCRPCTKCPQNAYVDKPCSLKTDTVCSACSDAPRTKSKYYVTSCEGGAKGGTGNDLHDVMMGDAAESSDVLDEGHNDEKGDAVGDDALKDGADGAGDDAADSVSGPDPVTDVDNDDKKTDDNNVHEDDKDKNGEDLKDTNDKTAEENRDTGITDNEKANDKTEGNNEADKKDENAEHSSNGEKDDDSAGHNTDDSGNDKKDDTADNAADLEEKQATDNQGEKGAENEGQPTGGEEGGHNESDEKGDKGEHGTGDETGPHTGDEKEPLAGDNTAADTEDDTAPHAGDDTVPDTGDDSVPDKEEDKETQTGDDTVIDKGDDTVPDKGDDKEPQTGDDAVPGTGDDTAADTGDDTASDTGDDKATDTGDSTAHEKGDDAASDPGVGAALHTDVTESHTGDDTVSDTGDKTEPDTGDDAAHEVGDDAANDKGGDSASDPGDDTVPQTVDLTVHVTGDDTASDTENDVTHQTEDNVTPQHVEIDAHTGDKEDAHNAGEQGDHETNGKAEDDTNEQTDPAEGQDGNESDHDSSTTKSITDEDNEGGIALGNQRVLQPEHKEGAINGVNIEDHTSTPAVDSVTKIDSVPSEDGTQSLESTPDIHLKANTEHEDETPSTAPDVSTGTEGDLDETDSGAGLSQTDKGAAELNGTTESPENEESSHDIVVVGNEGVIDVDTSTEPTALSTDEAEDGKHDEDPVLGRILSPETTNSSQAEEEGSDLGASTAAPQTDDNADVSDNDNTKTETATTEEEITTSEPVVTSEAATNTTEDSSALAVAIVADTHDEVSSDVTTSVPEEPSEGLPELLETESTTAEPDNITDESTTIDESKPGSLVRLGEVIHETKDVDEKVTEETSETTSIPPDTEELSTSPSTEEESTAKLPDGEAVIDGGDVEVIEVVTEIIKTTKRIPTLEELDAQFTDDENGSGEESVTINGEATTTQTGKLEDAEPDRPNSVGAKLGKSHEEDESDDDDDDDNTRTAIICGVFVGGVVLFALAFFVVRYYRKRRGHFKEMKKVNDAKDAMEFRPLNHAENNFYEDPDLRPTNGIYRPVSKSSPSSRKKKEEEVVDIPDLYAVPEKSKTAPLLGRPQVPDELSQSPSAQEPLISGVEKLKYIDDSTDDEYVNTIRERINPSRSPASNLTNVVEETPPTSPSIIQPSRSNWPANQSKPGASNGHSNGTAPRQTHPSVSSQGSFSTDVVNTFSKHMDMKLDGDRKKGAFQGKIVPSDEDIEC